MLALRGRNAAVLPSLPASCTSDGLDTRSARAHRANARAGPINPSADLAGRATRLGLEVIAKNPRQDFDQPGCQDGLRFTLTNLAWGPQLKRRTLQGRQILDQIAGFRLFLEKVEQDRLDKLNSAGEPPQMLDEQLPYAIALEVQEAWGDHLAQTFLATTVMR